MRRTCCIFKAQLEIREKLDLRYLVHNTHKITYGRNFFQNAQWRLLREGTNKTLCIIYNNGSVLCFCLEKKTVRRYLRLLQRIYARINVHVELKYIKIISQSYAHHLHCKVDLDTLAQAGWDFQQELLPCAVQKHLKHNICMTVFYTGAVNIVGIKKLKHLDTVVYPEIVNIMLYL